MVLGNSTCPALFLPQDDVLEADWKQTCEHAKSNQGLLRNIQTAFLCLAAKAMYWARKPFCRRSILPTFLAICSTMTSYLYTIYVYALLSWLAMRLSYIYTEIYIYAANTLAVHCQILSMQSPAAGPPDLRVTR